MKQYWHNIDSPFVSENSIIWFKGITVILISILKPLSFFLSKEELEMTYHFLIYGTLEPVVELR